MTEDDDPIQYYDHYEEKLKKTQEHKSKKFVEMGCIKYNKEGQTFICEPIIGYNTRTYQMKKKLDGRFRCNCQFMVTQENKVKMGILSDADIRPCSHIGALIMCFNENKFKKGGN